MQTLLVTQLGVRSGLKSACSFPIFQLLILFGLLGWSQQSLGQTVIAGYDVSGVTNSTIATLNSSVSAANVTVGQLTKGNGVGNGSNIAKAFGGTSWNKATAPDAVTANNFLTFTVKANSGSLLSLSAISPLNYRRSGTGPTNGLIQFQVDNGAFTDITTQPFTSTSASGATLAPIPLTGFTALQNLGSTNTVTFRIVPYGASANGGNWFIFDTGSSNAPDLAVTGTVSACPAITATSLTGTTTICNGSDATLTATISGGTAPYSLTLTRGASGTFVQSITSNVGSFTVSPNNTRTYNIIAGTDATGCPVTLITSSSATVTVVTPVTANAGTSQTIASGGVASLSANSPGSGTGMWTVSGPSTASSQFSSPTSQTATFTPDGGVGNYVLTWTITNAPCAPTSSNVTITVVSPTCGTLNVPGDYSTIQAAINAACSGALIKVAAGTYTEQLTITKSLSIVGAGIGSTIIQAPNTLAAGILNASHRNLIEINNNAVVTITGVKVNGPFASAGCGDLVYGININGGAGLDLSNSSVLNVYQTPTSLGGCQSGIGIRAGFNALSSPGSLTATNVTVSGYQKAGIVIDGAGSNGVIANATVTGAGPTTVIGQNGIQIGRGATGNVQSTTITNNNYTPPTGDNTTATGLLVFDSNVTATGNTFTGNDVGIDASDASTVTASNNRFSNGDYASVYVTSPATVNGTGNTYDKQVTNNSKPGTIYSFIQPAVDDAATNDVLTAAAGTFAEDITIDKALTLNGANAGIDPNTGTRGAETIVVPATTGADYDNGGNSIIVTLTGAASNVTIDGLTINGDNPNLTGQPKNVVINGVDIDAATAITSYGTSAGGLTIKNNIIKNLSIDGIEIGGTAASSNNTIQANKFDNIAYVSNTTGSGQAIYIEGNAYANITSNAMSRVLIGVQTGNHYLAAPGGTPSISNNTINAYDVGIFHNLQYQSATGFTIANNTISADNGMAATLGSSPFAGLLIYSILGTVPATLSGNTINAGFDNGIDAWNTPSPNVIVSGGSTKGTAAGIRVRNVSGSYGDGAANLTVSGVTVSNSPVGVLSFDNPSATSSVGASVTVTNNTQITGTGAFTAIAISGADASANITGNASSFVGNGSGTGVDVNGGSATVFQNQITNFTTGISVSNGGVLNASSENFIKSNADGIAYTSTATQGLLSGNDLSGNTNKSITNSAPGFINTSCNYYGAGSDPTLYVTGNVITSRFLSDGTDTQTGTPGFQGNGAACVCSGPGGTTVAVTNVTTGANYCTIQSAVDAATAGDVINVSGTFDELVTVNKSLTIVGVGATHTLTYTGTVPAGTLATLIKVAAANVAIRNLNFTVNLDKTHSAIHTSGDCPNLIITGNVITAAATGTLPTTGNLRYTNRNAIAVNPNTSPDGYTLSNSGFSGVVIQGNTVTGAGTIVSGAANFRAAVQMDLSGGTIGGPAAADGNTFTSINHDVNVRFSNNGPVTIQNNTSLGGGIQFAEPNGGAGLITIANNSLTGANVQPSTGVLQTGALMRIQNKSAAITLNVTNNTFADYRWAMSVENFNNVTLDGNTFTPRANTTDYRSISFNTKLLASSSATVTPVNIGATLTNNTFNGSGTPGGTAIAFFNHRQDGGTPAIGAFTLGTAGNENTFNAGIATFLRLDNSTGPSSGFNSPFGDYTVAGAPSTTMNYWTPDLNAVNNKFDVGTGLKLASALTSADRAALAGQLFDKNDDANVGRIIFYTPVQNVTQNTSFPTIQSAVDAAAPGDVISVQAGTYVENVTVPKSLTILGANSGINPVTGTRGAETIVLPAVAAATDASTTGPFNVFTLSAQNIVIDGFTLDGDNPNLADPTNSATINGVTIDATAGVSGNGAAVTGGAVRNNIIKNFTFDGVDFGSDAGPTFNTIENNSFDNIAYVSGVSGSGQAVVIYNNAYAAITGNTATRVRVGVQTNNFSQASPGGTPTISGNTFTVYRTGIFHNLHYQSATGFTITNNTITGDAPLAGTVPLAGIALSSIQTAVPVTVSGNTVNAGFPYGVEAWNTPTTGSVVLSGGSIQGSIAGVNVTTRNRFGDAGPSSKLTVSGVTINNSPVGVLAFDDPASANGISASVVVTDNTQITGAGAFTAIAISGSDASANITGNASSLIGSGSGTGVDVNGGTASVTADRIVNFTTGINVSNGGQLTGVMNSSVVNNTNGIVYAADANATQGIVTINDLSGNTGKAIINGLTSTTINANCNWFGPATASINPTYVTGNVSTTQVLANGTDEQTGTPGFQNTSCFTPPTAPILTVSAPANPQGGSYNATYCIGENPTVTTNYTTGTNSFTVSDLATGNTTVTTGNAVTITQGAGTYYVYATNSQNGYTSPVSSTYVQIQPEVTTFTSDKAAYCVGETVSLTALGCNVATASQPNLYFVRLRQLDGSGNINQGTAGLASGVSSYTYTQFAVATATSYTITAECVNGGTGQVCSTTPLAITANPLPVATLSSSNTLTCATPTATLTAGGGASYVFDGPGIVSQNGSATAVVNAAGVYSVTVTSAAGCVSTTTTTVSSDTALPTATLTASNSLNCAVTSATLTASASGGNSYSYAFSSGATQIGATNQATVSAGGSYSVTVTSANGCSVVATTSVTSDTAVPAAPVLTASAPANPQGGSYNATYCIGENPTVTSSYTTGTNSFTVSDLATGNTTVTTGNAVTITQGVGTYFVYATNTSSGNCVSPVSATTTIQVQPVVTSFTSDQSAYCVGATVSLTALGCNVATASQPNLYFVRLRQLDGSGNINQGTAGLASGVSSYTYTQFAVATATSYTITAECVNGGTGNVCGMTSLVIMANPLPVATLSSSNTLTCATPTATLTAGGGASYVFDGPGIVSQNGSATAVVNAAGVYSVTVTSAAGCVSTTTTTVSSDTALPTATLTASNSLNCAVTSATLTASASGGNSYSYAFSSGATQIGATNQATVSAGGSYSVTVTSANGCSVVATTSVTSDTTTPTATLVSSNTLTCAVTSTTLTAGGGVSYVFSGPGVVSSDPIAGTAVANVAGTYSVTVTAANGCTATTTTTVTSDTATPTAPVLTASTPAVNPGGPNESYCIGENPTVTSSYTTGTNSFTVSDLTTGNTTVTTGNAVTITQGPGTYFVTATNTQPNGCTSPVSATTTIKIQPVVTTFTSDKAAYCVGETVSLTALGCNVATSPVPGLYKVLLRALDGSNNENQGTAFLPTGATSYTYTQFASTSATSYTITAECVNVGTGSVCGRTALVIMANPLPVATLSSSNTLTCATPTATLTAGGGASYVFDGPGIVSQNGSATAVVNAAGVYSVTVTSAAGCMSTTTTTVSSDTALPTATLTASNSLNCAVTSATLTASASGGNSYSYAFSSGATQIGATNQATVSAGGSYSVTVTSANGCSVVATTNVISDTAIPTATLVSSNTLTCSLTSATLTATGGVSYTFSGPGVVSQSGNTAVVNVAGTYSVTATAVNGCLSTTTTSVMSDTATPTATLASLGSSTLTCAQTSVTLTASGGAPYTFSGPGVVSQSGNTAIVNVAGTYSVTVTGANGCTSTTTTGVSSNTTAPTATIASLGSSTLTCNQTSVTLTASGGVSYAFSGPGVVSQSGNTAVVNVAGTYSVTVTGANGCSSVTTTSVSSNTTAPTATLTTLGSSTLTCNQTSVTLVAGGGSFLCLQWHGHRLE